MTFLAAGRLDSAAFYRGRLETAWIRADPEPRERLAVLDLALHRANPNY